MFISDLRVGQQILPLSFSRSMFLYYCLQGLVQPSPLNTPENRYQENVSDKC